jgi:hypothetical protein
MLHVHAHEAARARCPLPRLPDSVDSAPAEARCNLRWPSARASERAASPVLLTACALLPRCRQPQQRAVGLDGHLALVISATRSQENPAAVTPALSRMAQAARGLCACETCACEAGRGRPRGCGPVGALLDPLTINSGPVDSVLVIGAMRTKGVATPAPPPATGPPHHRLSHDASPHSPV